MGSIRLYGATSGYLELQAPDVAPDATLTLPSDSVQPGLVHLHTETFSAVSSVSIDNVLSSDYSMYSIKATFRGTSVGQVRLQLRSGGSNFGSASYFNQRIAAYGTTVSNTRVANADYYIAGIVDAGVGECSSEIELLNPAETKNTLMRANGFADTDGGSTEMYIVSSINSSTSSFDGINFYPQSGTLTGSLRVYGYRNS